MQVTKKLCIHFEVFSILRSVPSLRCLQSVLQGVEENMPPEDPQGCLGGRSWFLIGVNGNHYIHIMSLCHMETVHKF